ncbi:tryptophan 7-halogenase [Streptomyces sp. P17]|uniref:tryptophan 7-halogenase n=1 Tax=Streptomyces sp. P17 TaxID=3074716 RepID=UPI0028F430D2|nr:tryptophan 7-halogenase [Streptomyces sp. P17]MDT9698417.1 tryptophan 7-halogenase [Streptomyces sp. P17]
MTRHEVYDAVVAGAGPAGAVAALVLARAGRRVALVDEPPGLVTGAHKVGESLPSAAASLLRDLNLWPGGVETHLRSTGMYVSWGSPTLNERGPVQDPYGPGWQLDRLRFDAFLREAAHAAGAEPLRGRAVDAADDGPCLRLLVRQGHGTRELRCAWAVDATGRRAVLARRRAVRRRQDRLVAAHVLMPRHQPSGVGESDQEARTVVEAVPGGWWYTTLTPVGRIVAHLTDPDLAGPGLRTPDGFLQGALRTRYIGDRLTAGDLTDPPAPCWSAAHGLRRTPYGGRGWIAAGDAALAFDPLSSQGILTALHSGARAGLATALCLAGAPPRPVLASYTDFLDGVAAAYVRHHTEAYAAETRWPELPFWQRRAAVRRRARQGPRD